MIYSTLDIFTAEFVLGMMACKIGYVSSVSLYHTFSLYLAASLIWLCSDLRERSGWEAGKWCQGI